MKFMTFREYMHFAGLPSSSWDQEPEKVPPRPSEEQIHDAAKRVLAQKNFQWDEPEYQSAAFDLVSNIRRNYPGWQRDDFRKLYKLIWGKDPIHPYRT